MDTSVRAAARRRAEYAAQVGSVGRRTGDPDGDDAARAILAGETGEGAAARIVAGTYAAQERLAALPADATEADAIAALGPVGSGGGATVLREMTGRGWRAAGHLGGWYYSYPRGPQSDCRQRAERV